MFSASLRRCNGAKCWLCAFTKGKRGAEWVFANGWFGFSVNAGKEQLSAAQAVLEKEKAGIACMLQLCRVAMVVANSRSGGMRSRT